MKRLVLAYVLVLLCSISFSQIRIDWQQCYGSFSMDDASRIAKKEGGYWVTGRVGDQSGMVSIPVECHSWVLDIDETGNIKNEIELGNYARDCEDFFDNLDGYSFYALGLPPNELGKEQLGIKKIDDNGDVIWETMVGNKNKSFWAYTVGTCTLDGSVIASTTTQWSGGDISNYYGENDAWVVKFDNQGNLLWEITLGTEKSEISNSIIRASDGGCYVCMNGNPGYAGSIPICQVPTTDEYDVLLSKIDTNGNIHWHHCYGGSKWDSFWDVLELENGFLLTCYTQSEDRDAEGAGYHFGYYHDIPYLGQTNDIWLIRTDADGNIIWSRCYGGTGMEFPTKAFQNEDGGFTVFGTTQSIDGDAQSALALYKPMGYPTDFPAPKIWVFRIDSEGNLLWERAIGHKGTGNAYIDLDDVVKLSDTEYTILATAEPPAAGYEGDFNCTNWDDRLCGYESYWVLHITDIFDYDAVEEAKIEEASISLFPNPTQGLLTVSGKEIRQVRLYDMLGQQVDAVPSYNGTNAMLTTNSLAAGIYMVQVFTANGSCVKRVVVGR